MQVHANPMKAAEPELLLQHNKVSVAHKHKHKRTHSQTGHQSAVPGVTTLADDATVEQAGQQVGRQEVGLTVGQNGDDGEELSA